MEGLLISSEMPEIRVMSNLIDKDFSGKKIKKISPIGNCKYQKEIVGLDNIKYDLDKYKINKTSSFGYHSFIELEYKDDIRNFIIIPRGSGRLIKKKTKYARIEIEMEDGSKFYYDDNKGYGDFIVKSKDQMYEKFNSIAFEPTIDYMKNFKQIKNAIRNSEYISAALNNFKVFCGVGIYMKSEALYDAKIFPYMPSNTIKNDQIELILNSIKKIYDDSVNCNGILNQEYSEDYSIEGKYFEKCNVFYKKRDSKNNRVVLSIRPEDLKTVFFVKEVQGYDK